MNSFGWIILLLFLMIFSDSWSQSTIDKCRRSTEGKEFWFGFMEGRNHHVQHYVEITVTARENTNFSIYIGKNTVPEASYTVAANNSVQIKINWSKIEATGSEQIQEKAIHLVSEKPVNVYALNWDQNSADVAVIYPVESLGTEYFAMCIEPSVHETSSGGYGNGRNSEFLIVASQDSTTVKITPGKVTDALRPADSTFTITLSKGEVYQVQSMNRNNRPGQGDLTGSHVVADKPVAFYSGSLSTAIPSSSCCWDHLYEQIPPVQAWGREFFAVPLASRQKDLYRIIAAEDNTKILIEGLAPVTLNRGKYYEFTLDYTQPSRIFSDKPILVAQFSQSRDTDNQFTGGNGDPFMIILSPVTQSKNDVTFVAYNSNQIIKYFVNIVVLTEEINNIELDGMNIAGQFKQFTDKKYSYAQIAIYPGTHRLWNKNPDRGFIAYVYGYGGVESYGYGVGFNLNLVLDLGESINFQGDTLLLCKGDSRILDAGPYFDSYDWNTGAKTQRMTVTEGGKYSVTTSTIDGCVLHDSIFIYLSSPKTTIGPDLSDCAPYSATLNAGPGFSEYHWNTGDSAQSLHVNATGQYQVTVLDKYGCPARDTMQFTVYPVPQVELSGSTLICGKKSGSFVAIFSGAPSDTWEKGNFRWETDKPEKLTFKNESVTSADFDVSEFGTYTIRYYLTTPDGCNIARFVTVGLFQTPTSSFNRIDNSSEKCREYNWEFRYDGNATQNATFYWDYGGSRLIDSLSWDRFTVSVGTFNSNPFITLFVEEDGCWSDTTRKAIGANPDFRMDTKKSRGCDSMTIQFSGELKVPDALLFEWDFGDGSAISKLQTPAHFYPDTGFYDVGLLITNQLTGCQIGFTVDNMVKIFPTPVAKISASSSDCYGDTIHVEYPLNIDSTFCYWEFEGARQIGAGNDSIRVLIEKPIATIRLKVDEFGCMSMPAEVKVKRKPHFDFTTDTTRGCQPFDPLVEALPYDDFLQFTWLTDTLPFPAGNQHIFSLDSAGVYSISLEGISTETGCRDTLLKTGWITVHPKPESAFEVDFPVSTVKNANLTFTNLSTLSEIFNWDFGDGETSDLKNPKHSFAQLGEYLVTLYVESEFGCKDTSDFMVKVLPFDVFTPNAFRPNSEIAENKLFMPVGIGVDPNRFHLLVYGRWGQLVFESKNPENKWDGKLKNGRDAPMDNYVWFAEFYDIQGFKHQQKGQVLLVR